ERRRGERRSSQSRAQKAPPTSRPLNHAGTWLLLTITSPGTPRTAPVLLPFTARSNSLAASPLPGRPVQGATSMKPNDDNRKLPTSDRPFRVLLSAGSARRQYNCPGVDSKARTLMLRMADRLPPEWEADLEDLGNVYGRAKIQSCNACVSTSMSLCCWPGNYYEKASHNQPHLI